MSRWRLSRKVRTRIAGVFSLAAGGALTNLAPESQYVGLVTGWAAGCLTMFGGYLLGTPTDDPELRPKVVCLCGSTRFRREYERAFRAEEHAGRICLTAPCFKDDPCCKAKEEQDKLDALHRAKIDLADEILVVNPFGYLGESTRAEVGYARSLGKPVRYLVSEVPA